MLLLSPLLLLPLLPFRLLLFTQLSFPLQLIFQQLLCSFCCCFCRRLCSSLSGCRCGISCSGNGVTAFCPFLTIFRTCRTSLPPLLPLWLLLLDEAAVQSTCGTWLRQIPRRATRPAVLSTALHTTGNLLSRQISSMSEMSRKFLLDIVTRRRQFPVKLSALLWEINPTNPYLCKMPPNASRWHFETRPCAFTLIIPVHIYSVWSRTASHSEYIQLADWFPPK